MAEAEALIAGVFAFLLLSATMKITGEDFNIPHGSKYFYAFILSVTVLFSWPTPIIRIGAIFAVLVGVFALVIPSIARARGYD